MVWKSFKVMANRSKFEKICSKCKNLWLIWCRTVDHRIGKTNDDEPNIPILTLKQAQISLLIRSFIILVNLITCFFIVANIIHKW